MSKKDTTGQGIDEQHPGKGIAGTFAAADLGPGQIGPAPGGGVGVGTGDGNSVGVSGTFSPPSVVVSGTHQFGGSGGGTPTPTPYPGLGPMGGDGDGGDGGGGGDDDIHGENNRGFGHLRRVQER